MIWLRKKNILENDLGHMSIHFYLGKKISGLG